MPPKQRAARPGLGLEKRSSSRGHWGGTELGAGQIYALSLGLCPISEFCGQTCEEDVRTLVSQTILVTGNEAQR